MALVVSLPKSKSFGSVRGARTLRIDTIHLGFAWTQRSVTTRRALDYARPINPTSRARP